MIHLKRFAIGGVALGIFAAFVALVVVAPAVIWFSGIIILAYLIGAAFTSAEEDYP